MRKNVFSLIAACLLFALPATAKAQWTSSYAFVNIAGDFNGFETLTPNMTLVSNGVWQHYATITNTPDFQFLFATELFTNTWKETDQDVYTPPIAAFAEFNDGNDIVVSNATSGPFRFLFSEVTGAYSVQDVSIPLVAAENIWINEIDYDNPGTDSNEWVEIAGKAGLSLDAYELVLIASNGSEYSTFDLDGAGLVFPDESNGYGFLVIGRVETSLLAVADYTPVNWTQNVIQNGPLDSVQLRVKVGGANEHLVDYEGDNPFTLENQVATTDTGATGRSMYLTGGPGLDFGDFTWESLSSSATPGAANLGQTFTGIPSQPASSVAFSDLQLTPFPPKTSDPVELSLDIEPVDGASNIVATTFYRFGTTGPFFPLSMSSSGAKHTTDASIPAQASLTEVQYYVFATYDGLGTNSPSLHPPFGPSAPFQYTVPNVERGTVWLNELNYNPDPSDSDATETNEFIELAGLAGTDIGDWRIELWNTAGRYAFYDVPAPMSFGNETNGFGFWVLGDSGVPETDQTLTVEISEPQHLAKRGAIRLLDQFDQTHFEYSYGDPEPAAQFPDAIYIGFEDDFFAFSDESLAMTGSGSNYFDFAWSTNSTLTPGAINVDQTLVEVIGENPPNVIILDVALTESTIEIISLGTNSSWAVDAEVSTNLLTGWSQIMNETNSYENGTNSTTIANPGTQALHFRIRQTKL